MIRLYSLISNLVVEMQKVQIAQELRDPVRPKRPSVDDADFVIFAPMLDLAAVIENI